MAPGSTSPQTHLNMLFNYYNHPFRDVLAYKTQLQHMERLGFRPLAHNEVVKDHCVTLRFGSIGLVPSSWTSGSTYGRDVSDPVYYSVLRSPKYDPDRNYTEFSLWTGHIWLTSMTEGMHGKPWIEQIVHAARAGFKVLSATARISNTHACYYYNTASGHLEPVASNYNKVVSPGNYNNSSNPYSYICPVFEWVDVNQDPLTKPAEVLQVTPPAVATKAWLLRARHLQLI